MAKDKFKMEMLGVLTHFDPLTQEELERCSTDGLTMEELLKAMSQAGLKADRIVHDPTRQYSHTYYADYEKGVYQGLELSKESIIEGGALQQIARMGMPQALRSGDYARFYSDSVPLPMMIYDFTQRYKSIPDKAVFEVWHNIYKIIDFANGMWQENVINDVFALAPKPKLPAADGDGGITLYRGMGALSTPPEKAISWSTHPGNALWFANSSGRGVAVAVARVLPEQIVAYYEGYSNENEVIVRPGTITEYHYEDMIPAANDTVIPMLEGVLPDYIRYGAQVARLGYQREKSFQFHGMHHILRVLLLSLIYYFNSIEAMSEADKRILIYFSLLHDIGRENEETDASHGRRAVELIHRRGIRIRGLPMSKKEFRIAELIIEHHCHEDAVGEQAIQDSRGLTAREKEHARYLYQVCKDMDGLDRVRFNGLDYRMLRTAFGRRLPLVAGALMHENLEIFGDSTAQQFTT